MKEEDNINRELEDLSPFLKGLRDEEKQKSSFKIPDNYFNNFEDRLMARIGEEKALTPKTKKDSRKASFWMILSKLFKPQYAVGFASVTLVGALGLMWMLNNKNSNNPFDYQSVARLNVPAQLEEIPVEDANAYLLAHIDEVDTEELTASLEQESINNLSVIHQYPPSQDTTKPIADPKDNVSPNPPKNEVKVEDEKKDSPSPKMNSNKKNDLVNNLDREVLDDTEWDDILGDVTNEDLDLLEGLLLKKEK
ncbi:MAG: hypothetical protein MK212_00545 [Saprospiraceae bacterium]|nr:hypothetical protein [Saprospiraceae bacterium]